MTRPDGAPSNVAGGRAGPARRGWRSWRWRGLGGTLGLARPAGGEVALEWSEGAAAESVLGRAVELALPARLPAGDYTLILTARFPGHPPATAERRIRVER